MGPCLSLGSEGGEAARVVMLCLALEIVVSWQLDYPKTYATFSLRDALVAQGALTIYPFA